MTYLELYNLRHDEEFRKRVVIAGQMVANSIMWEGDAFPDHAKRLLWANAIRKEDIYTDGTKKLMALVVQHDNIKNLTLAQVPAITDQQIFDIVVANLGFMADGVYGA